MTDIKELFKRFVFGYITSGHTQTNESEQELKRLIDEFIKHLDDNDCFNRNTMYNILDYVERNITDDNKGFYTYGLYDFRYISQLEHYIKYIINSF